MGSATLRNLGGRALVGSIFRHPEPGDVVGDYRLVEKLGEGSFGLVFKAERAGRYFAMKFLHDATWGARARREVAILAEMDHPCVVRFHGFDRWPVPMIGTPYIVMDLVEGLTLESHAAAHNPSARKAARLIFQAGLTLGEIHQRGVFHRDLKPANIVIAGKGEVPVFVDFGVGWHVGAPVATEEGTSPGTVEFQAPEAIQRVGRHECRPSDELWALGVCFYWLLTDILPFGDRLDDGFMERVLHLKPLPPHVLNPRVPEVLSAVCVKMLEKNAGIRYATVVEFCAALDKALSEADLDESWDLPLFDSADSASDEKSLVGLDEPNSMHWIRRWIRESPRRGGKPAQEQDEGSSVNQGERKEWPGVPKGAACEPASMVTSVMPEVPTPADLPVVAAPLAQPSRSLRRASARRQGPVWAQGLLGLNLPKWPLLALIAGVMMVSLVVGAVGLLQRPTSASNGSAAFTRVDTATPPPVASPHENAMGQTERVREVAWSGNPAEAGRGAAPVGAITPALKASAMLRNPKSRFKARKKPATQPQLVAIDCIPVLKRVCAAGVCSLMITGCPGPSSQVRPTPEPEACPPGALEAMSKLGFGVGWSMEVLDLTPGNESSLTVQEGRISGLMRKDLGKLPAGTVLHGRLIVRESRVYGRFTLAEKPNGDTSPVCLQMESRDEAGVPRVDEGGGASAAIVNSPKVTAVRRFE